MNIIEQQIDPILADLIMPEDMTLLTSYYKEDVLEEMASLLLAHHAFCDESYLLGALTQREGLVSTGIGMGIAIPHARIDVEKFYFAVGLSTSSQGIDWESIDQMPVRLVFMLVGPKDRAVDFLKLLSSLTYLLKSEQFRERLFQSKSSRELYSHFSTLTLKGAHDKSYIV